MNALSKRLGHVQRVTARATSSCAQSSARRSVQVLPTRMQTRSYSEAAPISPAAPVPPPDMQQDNLPGPSLQDQEALLNSLFPPLVFPPEMAARILTHASHSDAAVRHNARLTFIGRRVLHAYLHLFLTSTPAFQEQTATVAYDADQIAERALNTYILGEHIAPRWGLGRALKWTPRNTHLLGLKPRSDPRGLLGLPHDKSRSVGLYKVHGTAVEAVVGGVYHQFGGDAAHRLFHTRMLPHILLPGRAEGLHEAFHDEALAECKRMGGENAPLVKSS